MRYGIDNMEKIMDDREFNLIKQTRQVDCISAHMLYSMFHIPVTAGGIS
ncbi:hypothetical protein KDA08_00735 [Candidatus Saccharibacteria bacterium]|nr:hypothetical protein [Candidatus Saccharibacteria bacterium]